MDNSKYYYFDEHNNLKFHFKFFNLSEEEAKAVYEEGFEEYKKRVALGCKNVSASEILMSRNFDRSLVKKTVCLRVPQDLVHSYQSFAGRLNVPVQDLFNYVLKYGFLSLREIKEI